MHCQMRMWWCGWRDSRHITADDMEKNHQGNARTALKTVLESNQPKFVTKRAHTP